MLKQIALVLFLLGMAQVAQADALDVFKSALPNTSTAMYYSRRGHEANFMVAGTLVPVETKIGTFCLDAAYGESDTGILAAVYKTETLSKLGVDVVVLKDVFAKVGYGAGFDHISKSDRTGTDGPIIELGAALKF